MMEIREAVSEADDSQTLEKIQSQVLMKHIYNVSSTESIVMLQYFWVHIVHNLFQMKRKLETWSKSFQEAFDKRDFNRAVEATQRMRYYERAMEETVKKL
jgi:molecular chaperone HscB